MTAADEKFVRQFARLSATFIAELPRQLAAMNEDLTAWSSSPRDAALLDRLSQKVHKLKGSGSTFGCRGVSDAAGVVERYLTELRAEATGDPASALKQVEAAMDALLAEAQRVHGESVQGDRAGAGT